MDVKERLKEIDSKLRRQVAKRAKAAIEFDKSALDFADFRIEQLLEERLEVMGQLHSSV